MHGPFLNGGKLKDAFSFGSKMYEYTGKKRQWIYTFPVFPPCDAVSEMENQHLPVHAMGPFSDLNEMPHL